MPIRIDGTDITGATIDGTDVTEITVDGQTVFTAMRLPVAFTNLFAWYPLDSSTYGGSNVDDVTAILGGSADDTGFNLTNTNAIYISTGGTTDIRAGINSGAFDFDGNGEIVGAFATDVFDGNLSQDWTCSLNLKTTDGGAVRDHEFISIRADSNNFLLELGVNSSGVVTSDFMTFNGDWNSEPVTTTTVNDGNFHNVTSVYDDSSGDLEIYIDGSVEDTISNNSMPVCDKFAFGSRFDSQNPPNAVQGIDGIVDDVRLYNKALNSSEVNQIVSNTI